MYLYIYITIYNTVGASPKTRAKVAIQMAVKDPRFRMNCRFLKMMLVIRTCHQKSLSGPTAW